MDGAIKTTCPYCGVGCGVLARVFGDEVQIEGDPDHPANSGRLCSKGAALADVLVPDGRLLHPMVDGQKASWSGALNAVADTFSQTIAAHGPDSVAFYVSGQLLTEDYYVANKLMKGFIGSGNIDTNSRLCMASAVAGHKRAFGEDAVPGTYEDLELADLIVLTGSNFAWCHPVLFQRILAEKEKRPSLQIVALDPRDTATTAQADLHIALKPGSDIALFQGLLKHLNSIGAADSEYVAAHVEGMDTALHRAEAYDLQTVSRATGVGESRLNQLFSLFARTQRTVTVFSQGINQAADGTNRVGAIINCHLLTGRVGKPGASPFSITGQPNAMGGREVGGLANQLACHLDIENPDHRAAVQAFWHAPTIASKPGLKAVEMFDAVADGRIKAIWIMGTNPVDSLPNANAVKAALEACSMVVVSDVTAQTDTADCADILLPAMPWGEKDGTVTNSERRISRQRALRPSRGEARQDWWALCEVAKRMGHKDAFTYTSPGDIFREYAAMTKISAPGKRMLDLGPFAAISSDDYNALKPQQWPIGPDASARLYGDGLFCTPSGKARAIVPASARVQEPATTRYILNTGRIRDQWHTMTRTGLSAKLSQQVPEPFVDICPADALREGIAHASLVRVSSPQGSAIARARITGRQRQGSVFMPMHWTAQFTAKSRVDALVAPVTDPISGQPALKSSHVDLAPFAARQHGFIVATQRPPLEAAYWAIAACQNGYRAELAGDDDQPAVFETWFTAAYPKADLIRYSDPSSKQTRLAVFDSGTLLAAGYFGSTLIDVARQWVVDQLGETLPPSARCRLLAGRPAVDSHDEGAMVCACMGVGRKTIEAAAAKARTVADIGRATSAGTGCGSCRYEIKAILGALPVQEKEDAIATAI